METGNSFNGAEYFDCNAGKEYLSYTTPEEALEYFFDGLQRDGVSIEEDIETYSPVTVYAWHRIEPDLTIFASGLVDSLAESIRDDAELGLHGNCSYDPIKWDSAALEKSIAAAIAPFGKHVVPWCCEQTSNREYSAAEVTEILRAQCPTWFSVEVCTAPHVSE